MRGVHYKGISYYLVVFVTAIGLLLPLCKAVVPPLGCYRSVSGEGAIYKLGEFAGGDVVDGIKFTCYK